MADQADLKVRDRPMKLCTEETPPGEGQSTQSPGAAGRDVSGAWLAFIRYCRHLGHGEIERLRIQDGIPVLAEITTKKVKFGL